MAVAVGLLRSQYCFDKDGLLTRAAPIERSIQRVVQRYVTLRCDFHWHTMRNDVLFICIEFQRVSQKRKATQAAKRVEVISTDGPFEFIVTDIIGALPTTKYGNQFIIIIVDYHENLTRALHSFKTSTTLVAKFFINHGIIVTEHPPSAEQKRSTVR